MIGKEGLEWGNNRQTKIKRFQLKQCKVLFRGESFVARNKKGQMTTLGWYEEGLTVHNSSPGGNTSSVLVSLG